MIQGLIPTDRRLFEIADDLLTWFDSLELTETDIDRQHIQAEIDRLGAELVKKAENIAGVLRRIKSECEQIAAEEMRLTARRIAFEKAANWLKSYTMSVMREKGLPYLKTPTVTLAIQGNGGIQPLVIDGEVPPEFNDITVKMPLALFVAACNDIPPSDVCRIKQVALEPSQARIREALAQPCAKCKGIGAPWNNSASVECEDCHGTGKAQVPGAHLGERGEHLRIS